MCCKSASKVDLFLNSREIINLNNSKKIASFAVYKSDDATSFAAKLT